LFDRTGKLEPNPENVQIYDYEMTPQACIEGPRIPMPIPGIFTTVRQINQVSDATIMVSGRAFEPKSAESAEDWYTNKLHKRLFFFGAQAPINPAVYQPPSDAMDASNPFRPVWEFLSNHPPNSTLVVSFGSVWYPSSPQWPITTFLRTLLDTHTPFIFSRAAVMYVPLDPTLASDIEQSKDAVIADYIPQRELLGHPSVAAFVSHGGVNSLFESILGGVRNIFWPITADQPLHAAYMSQNLDCAWELIQVRTGIGAGPPRRGGQVEGTPEALAAEVKQVLEEIKSPVGERKKRNLLALRERFVREMASDEEGGSVGGAVKDFLAFVSEPPKVTRA